METNDLEQRIIERGRAIFTAIGRERPALYDPQRWLGEILERCMANEAFKVQMFRFVDVFPSLRDGEALTRHLREYFGEGEDVPKVLRAGARLSALGGKIGGALLARALRKNIREMARQFIIGENTKEAVRALEELRAKGYAAVVDVLGEATLSDIEADTYVETNLQLLTALEERRDTGNALRGDALGEPGDLDWGHAPQINISVKPTACHPQTRPVDFEGSVNAILSQLRRIYRRVIAINGFLCIDMESYQYKEITLEVYRRLREEFPDYPHLGIALQAYLRETGDDTEELLAWARSKSLPISVRLVKGAYWDFETVHARQNGWRPPVFSDKNETDATFERVARRLLENHDICHLACASHNVRSIAAVMEIAAELDVPPERYEFQVLYGMAEPVRKALLGTVGRVRLYCPFGNLAPGLAYLVRRLLENTANESFLRQSFVDSVDQEHLLADPAQLVPPAPPSPFMETAGEDPPPFRNEPQVNFAQRTQRETFAQALAGVRQQLGREYPLFIDGKEVRCDETVASLNPASPREIVGLIHQAGPEQVEAAVAAATKALPQWRATVPDERADYLVWAAEIGRGRIFELAAWQVYEVGKQWDQAHADVTEAIDFLSYYAQEIRRLGKPRTSGGLPGEDNLSFYQPRGVAAVIAPWNFPLAISCGMTAAALAAGNCVVYKPSGLSPVIGYQLCELLREAGLPPGVFNYLPGSGARIGDTLVEHPGIDLIAFTGSMEVGLGINEKAARIRPGQSGVKKVITEMGGKNAIIIDDDADLDEAIPGVLASAFAYQGQKCSACSRVIVLDAVYDHFVERLAAAARSLKIGPAEDPANVVGPVVDAEAQKKVLNYLELAEREGTILYRGEIPDGGYYVPLTIVTNIKPTDRLAQEEVFGPLLAVMRVKDFEQALEWANATRFALTGGLFSRSPEHLQQARSEFMVGNLYLNRGITGALVERQPFGGFGLSGIGSKAGGPDYLLQFMVPRTVTENTMRRGFTPEIADH